VCFTQCDVNAQQAAAWVEALEEFAFSGYDGTMATDTPEVQIKSALEELEDVEGSDL
jgi:hypothetical protein